MHNLNDLVAKDGFRLRGRAMSRIDGFSDVVFGFALTLIVVSLEVPKTYTEFHESLLGFFPFALCFLFLIMLWWAHFRFFRRYGLHDFATILINSVLLFLLLFYVYPLKFLFNIWAKSIYHTLPENVFENNAQVREMMVVYALGFAAVYFAITALYANAWRLRKDMHLNRLEVELTLSYIWDFGLTALIGVVSAVFAHFAPDKYVTSAGLIFFAIAITKTVHGTYFGARARKIRQTLTPEENAPLPNTH